MKQQIFREASEFIKAQSQAITATLTRDHHSIIEQYKAYKMMTQDRLNLTDVYQRKY